MQSYLDLVTQVLEQGTVKSDRTGTGTRSIFGAQLRHDLTTGFPLLTTKRVHFRSVVYELLWFLRGDTNVRWLQEHGVTIWDEWADAEGNLGPVYGAQWRHWTGPDGVKVDQIDQLMKGLRTDPDSRRHVVSAWNVGQLSAMKLAPCHCLFQFWVGDGRLSCQLYQRSADIFLGVPFNIASYALLTHMIAQQCDLMPGELVMTFGDLHLYSNHEEQARIQLSRNVRSLPQLELQHRPSIDDYVFEDFVLKGYEPHPAIRAPVAV